MKFNPCLFFPKNPLTSVFNLNKKLPRLLLNMYRPRGSHNLCIQPISKRCVFSGFHIINTVVRFQNFGQIRIKHSFSAYNQLVTGSLICSLDKNTDSVIFDHSDSNY